MRKTKSLKNLLSSLIPYVIVLLLGFVKVDVFLSSLGEEIYALNQLFFQLFAYISLAEAGACSYIIQLYYKHFVSNDKDKINEIYSGSIRFMRIVAGSVFGIGFILSFFIKYLTNNNLNDLYMQVVFLIFILRSVFEYLLMSPKLVMQADQKLYKVNIIYYIFKILELVFEIILLICGMDYIVTLLSSMILRVSTYLLINKKVFKEYPWLSNKAKNKNVKIKGINNMFVHRISEAVHYNTDIILASSFLSPLIVTIYSSYNYITKYLSDGIDIIGSSISASMGNVIYKEKNDEKVKILNELISTYFAFAIFFCSVTYVMMDSFVSLWIGKKYLMNDIGLVILIVNLFIVIARKPLHLYFNSAGWYKETKLIVALEAIFNLIISLLLVKKYKITGLLVGTCLSMLMTTFWFIPKFVLKDKLKQSVILYFGKYFSCVLITTILSIFGKFILSKIKILSFISWGICGCIVSLINLIIIFLIFYLFDDSFKRIFKKIFGMFKKRRC